MDCGPPDRSGLRLADGLLPRAVEGGALAEVGGIPPKKTGGFGAKTVAQWEHYWATMGEHTGDEHYKVVGLPPGVGPEEVDSWVRTLGRFISGAESEHQTPDEAAAIFLSHYNIALGSAWQAYSAEQRKQDMAWKGVMNEQRLAYEAERTALEAERESIVVERQALEEDRQRLDAASERLLALEVAKARQPQTSADGRVEPTPAPEQPAGGHPDDGTWAWAVAQVYWRFDRRALITVFWVVVALVFIVWLFTSNTPIDYFGR